MLNNGNVQLRTRLPKYIDIDIDSTGCTISYTSVQSLDHEPGHALSHAWKKGEAEVHLCTRAGRTSGEGWMDKKGNCANPNHSGGEDTYGAARSVEVLRKEEGKWGNSNGAGGNSTKGSRGARGGNNYRGKNYKQPSRRVGSEAVQGIS
eukprot:CAMPEP_0116041518 /NCGR_PEP_ID=MMETSP0321-20121206/25110_1 /TAXON_ID=163516 /ORGANISM="Leptocylindrus danicus var. danicus, Strain B650" /LENGTH=148 /DNA_ID=CAMNT_0003521755 /DNA_START=9 /DNA_END=456 /DNA_ORIENTATION=+